MLTNPYARALAGAWGKFSFSVATQALGSLAHLALNFYLLYGMSLREFGLFGIGFAIIMAIVGCGQSFFITQYIVLSFEEDSEEFAGVVLKLLISIFLLIGAIVYGASFLVRLNIISPAIILCIVIASMSFTVKEFYIRVLFEAGKGGRAIAVNGVMAVAMVIALLSILLQGSMLTAPVAIAAYTIVLVATAFFGHWLAQVPFKPSLWKDYSLTLKKLAVGGRWAVLNSLTFAVRNNAHTFILAGVLGPTAVGLVNAGRLFLSPPLMFLPALVNVALPQLSRIWQLEGSSALRRYVTKLGAALVTLTLSYGLGVLLLWPFLRELTSTAELEGMRIIISFWVLLAVMRVSRTTIEWGLQAQRSFNSIFTISAIVAGISLCLTLLLSIFFGVVGALISLILAEAMIIAGFLLIRRQNAIMPKSSPGVRPNPH